MAKCEAALNGGFDPKDRSSRRCNKDSHVARPPSGELSPSARREGGRGARPSTSVSTIATHLPNLPSLLSLFLILFTSHHSPAARSLVPALVTHEPPHLFSLIASAPILPKDSECSEWSWTQGVLRINCKESLRFVIRDPHGS